MTLPTILIIIIFGSAILYILSLLIKSFKSTPDLRQQESDIYESYFNQKINDKNSK